MDFLIPLNHYHIENVQFLKIKKNIVMENSLFIKMIYSDENLVMNGIYLDIPLLPVPNGLNMGVNQNQNHSSLFFFSRDTANNQDIILKLVEMENDILQYYQYITPAYYEKKTPVYSMKSQLEKGYIKWGFSKKPFPKTLQHVCLKISGIWENNQEYGINYKFLPSEGTYGSPSTPSLGVPR